MVLGRRLNIIVAEEEAVPDCAALKEMDVDVAAFQQERGELLGDGPDFASL
jgi:hypothetical protein